MKRTIYRTTKLLSSLAGMLMLTAVMMIGCNPNVTTPQQQKGGTLTITLTQSPAKETKTNGTVTVTVTVTSSTSIKEAKWKEGDHKTKDVFAKQPSKRNRSRFRLHGNAYRTDSHGK